MSFYHFKVKVSLLLYTHQFEIIQFTFTSIKRIAIPSKPKKLIRYIELLHEDAKKCMKVNLKKRQVQFVNLFIFFQFVQAQFFLFSSSVNSVLSFNKNLVGFLLRLTTNISTRLHTRITIIPPVGPVPYQIFGDLPQPLGRVLAPRQRALLAKVAAVQVINFFLC